MGVYYHLTTQIKDGDSWKTIKLNGHKTIYNSGGWLNSLFNYYPPVNCVTTEEFPKEEMEEDTFGHLAILVSSFNNYIDIISEENEKNKAKYVKESQFSRIEAKLDCILNKTEYTPNDDNEYFDEEDFDDERIECLDSIIFFSRTLAELYSNSYVKDSDIRMLICFDW